MSVPSFNGNGAHEGDGQDYAALAAFASQWAAAARVPPPVPAPPRLHPPHPPGYRPFPPGSGYSQNPPPGFYGSPHMRPSAPPPRIKTPLIPRPGYLNPPPHHNNNASGGFFSPTPYPHAQRMVPPRGPPNSWEWNSQPPQHQPPPPPMVHAPPRMQQMNQPPPPPMYSENEEKEWSVSYDPELEAEGDEYVKSCVPEPVDAPRKSSACGGGAEEDGDPDEDVGAMSHWLTGTAEAACQQLPPHDHVAHAEWLKRNLSSGGEMPYVEAEKPQKKLPAFLQEVLDKKERERKKREEQEERERLLEQQRRQQENYDNDQEFDDRYERQTDEELQEIMDGAIRSIMTKLLLTVTDSMIERISRETLEKVKLEAKCKAEPQILTSCPALAAISAFGDDSDEENDINSNSPPDPAIFKAPLPPSSSKKQLSDRSQEPKQHSPESSSKHQHDERSHERRGRRDDDDPRSKERKRRRRSRSSERDERRHKRSSRSRSPDRSRRRDSRDHHRR